ncbi:MAG TPA: hypothetical protein PKX40_14130 [Spirochaetota bacterium]|nr:hypothetical protein [Spirochaetota bacterium]
MESNIIVKAENLEKIYGFGRSALPVLKGVSLEIGKGEIISIVGPPGLASRPSSTSSGASIISRTAP